MYGIKINDMEDGAHHYLAQIPLTVSPFISLPTATTLPYTYKSIPTSAMPPSSTGEDTSSSSSSGTDSKPKFVVAQSGHAAHPDDIVASCQALTAHVQKIQNDSDALFQKWQADIQARDLAEKRRVAPGWLDRNEKILEPLRKASDSNVMDMLDDDEQQADAKGLRLRGMKGLVERRDEEGEAMDRAFGGLSVQ